MLSVIANNCWLQLQIEDVSNYQVNLSQKLTGSFFQRPCGQILGVMVTKVMLDATSGCMTVLQRACMRSGRHGPAAPPDSASALSSCVLGQWRSVANML